MSIDKDLQKVVVKGDAVDGPELLQRVQKVRKNADFWVEEPGEQPPEPLPLYSNAYSYNYPYGYSNLHYWPQYTSNNATVNSPHTCTCSVCTPHSAYRYSYGAPPYYTHTYAHYPYNSIDENPSVCSIM